MDLKRSIILSAFLVSFSGLLSAAPILRLSQSAVGPVVVGAGNNAATQTVYASNIGDGSLNLTATASAPWLSPSVGSPVSCPSGAGTCIPIQVALNTSGLPVGTYTEFVTVTDPAAVDAPQTISITVQVGGVPPSLDLYVQPNGGTASATVQTQNPVSSAVATQSGGNWLSVNGGGSFAFFVPYVVTGTSQPGQAPGDYTGTVTFSGSNYGPDNATLPVTLHVTTLPVLQLTGNAPRLSAVAGGSAASATLSFMNAGSGTATINAATVASGSNFLTATVQDASHVLLTATPGSLPPGYYTATVTLNSNAANPVTVPVVFVVRSTSAPAIYFSGVVDNATGSTTLAPGEIGSVYGDQLISQAPMQALALPLPTVLGGASVLVNGVAAPLYYSSAGQINFQLPSGTAPGQAIVTVQRDGQAGNQVTVNVAARSPKVLKFQPPYGNTPIIVNQDGTVPVSFATALPNRTAKVGDYLVIYMIGLGPTTPAVPDGVGAPATEPLARVSTPVMVALGGGFMKSALPPVQYAGLTPNFVGLYQVNIQIPADSPTGPEVPLTVFTQDGAVSNVVNISITQ